MFRFRRWQHFLPPLILAVSLFTLYLCTLAPGLTWANDGSDGGDLITAAATGGVPHPTGYPLYLLVARAMIDQLRLIDANVLGIVLNGVPRGDSYYFDGYYRDTSVLKLEENEEKIIASEN